MTTPTSEGPRLLRVQDVAEQIGYCRATIYRLVKVGKFPQPIKLGPRATRWRISDIDAWIASRPVGLGPPVCQPKGDA